MPCTGHYSVCHLASIMHVQLTLTAQGGYGTAFGVVAYKPGLVLIMVVFDCWRVAWVYAHRPMDQANAWA